MLISNFQNGRKNGKDDFNIMSPNSEKVYIFQLQMQKKIMIILLSIRKYAWYKNDEFSSSLSLCSHTYRIIFMAHN